MKNDPFKSRTTEQQYSVEYGLGSTAETEVLRRMAERARNATSGAGNNEVEHSPTDNIKEALESYFRESFIPLPSTHTTEIHTPLDDIVETLSSIDDSLKRIADALAPKEHEDEFGVSVGSNANM